MRRGRQPRARSEHVRRATGRAEVLGARRATGGVGDGEVGGEQCCSTNPVRVGLPFLVGCSESEDSDEEEPHRGKMVALGVTSSGTVGRCGVYWGSYT